MSRRLLVFDLPDRFVVGTVGLPGERTFFLQARAGDRLVSVALEKVQVSVLAERVNELLAEVRRRADTGDEPGPDSGALADADPLDSPVEEEFRVGTLALAWDDEDQRVVIEAHAVADDTVAEPQPFDDDTVDGPDVLRVRLAPAAAHGFADRALRVIAAGRPPCPLCGQPVDPEGHACPKQNGHRR
ncbi:MAG TPA: DUF3090 family protein [Mycobacteriales bacterium]|nr:DUF3090 family protein [Mycobacteriales bacterium]